MESGFFSGFDSYGRYILPALAIIILAWCCISLFRRKPLPEERARLVDTFNGTSLYLKHSENSIGRSGACDISIANRSVSRFHAVISKRHDGWIVIDTNSKLGITINGTKVNKKEKLYDGDYIYFGHAKYIFRES